MRLAFLLWLAAAVTVGASEPPPYLGDAAQDRAGDLWAYNRAERDRIFRFDGKAWEGQDAPFDATPQTMAVKVARRADGAVVCVWSLDEKTFAVTRHLGTEKPRTLGICEGHVEGDGSWATLTADSKNRVWITDSSSRVYCADDRGVRLACEIKPDDFDRPPVGSPGYNGVHAAEDGRGRIWLWSDAYEATRANVRGVLVLSGDGRTELHDLATPLKKGKLLAVARLDDRHLAVSVAEDGVYRVDIDSFELARMDEPSPGSLAFAREMFANGGDLYAVNHGARFQDSVWRWRDEQWQKLIANADPREISSSPRAWLPLGEGLLVQSSGGGPWFIPTSGEPAQFSWRSGLPLEDTHGLARLADGTFFALGPSGRIFHGPLTLPPRDQENPRVARIDTNKGWVVDVDGHPWTATTASPRVLFKWKGETWGAYPVPAGPDEDRKPGVPAPPPPDLRADAEGRIWVMGDPQYKLHVFDTRSGQWQEYPKEGDAYLALRELPPHFLGEDVYVFGPQYASDGRRVAFRAGVTECHYFDGSAWRKFSRLQIDGNKKSNYGVGPPWFDKDGRLCVNIRPGITWRLGDDGQWLQTPFEGHFPKDHWSETAVVPALAAPDGCVTNQPDSVVLDNRGTYWLTWQNALYRAVPGRCIRVFAADEPNPFQTERRLTGVYVDARGNAFLETRREVMDDYLLKPKSAPPHTTLAVEPAGADAVTARFHTESGASPVEFRWRLDDGPWQSTRDDTLALRNLPDGGHVLVVSATDAELQSDAVPASAAFEVKVDPARQIAELVAGLSDPDYERRKAAVDALARQPDRSVPALRQARGNADAELRWWIDAALEQIERTKSAAPPPSEKSP